MIDGLYTYHDISKATGRSPKHVSSKKRYYPEPTKKVTRVGKVKGAKTPVWDKKGFDKIIRYYVSIDNKAAERDQFVSEVNKCMEDGLGINEIVKKLGATKPRVVQTYHYLGYKKVREQKRVKDDLIKLLFIGAERKSA